MDVLVFYKPDETELAVGGEYRVEVTEREAYDQYQDSDTDDQNYSAKI